MRNTIDMAREAGLVYLSNGLWWMDAGEASYELKAFEALVRADEREDILRMSGSQWFKSQLRYDEAIRARGNT